MRIPFTAVTCLCLLAVACATPPAADLRERTAITNLVYRYAHLFDGGQFDEFLSLFADDMVFQFASMPESDKSSIAALRERNASFAEQGIQRRHIMTNLVIHDQDADQASGTVYFILMSNEKSELSTIGTGRYEFGARNTGDGWRLDRWRILPDGPLPGAKNPFPR